MKFGRTYFETRAFTLLEIILAVAIFAVVLTAMNSVFYGALHLRERTTRLVESSLPIQQTVTIVKRDLQGLVAPAGTLAGPLQIGVATANADPNGGQTIYTTTGAIDDVMPWGDIQKVVYSLRAPTNRANASGSDLVRSVTRNLLATMDDLPVDKLLLTDVSQIQFFFYDGTDWRNSWDSTAEPTVLPQGIKMEIDLAATEERRIAMPIQIVVPVTVQANTNQTSTTGGTQ